MSAGMLRWRPPGLATGQRRLPNPRHLGPYVSSRPLRIDAPRVNGQAAATSDAAASGAANRHSQQDSPEVSSSSASTATAAPGGASHLFSSQPALLRRALSATSAGDALDVLLQHAAAASKRGGENATISAADAQSLIEAALEQGNSSLALSVYAEMCRKRRSGSGASTPSSGASGGWPAATLGVTEALVLGLCRQLCVAEALDVMAGMRAAGMPRAAAEVSFGHVVSSPLPPRRPLAVVQPQEGGKVVADAASRYEFELYSGTVVTVKSEALMPPGGPLAGVLRALAAVGVLRPPVGAVHEFVVQAPDGRSRTFRAGTEGSDVPGQPGERVTVVCAPGPGAARKQARLLLSTSPPGTRPGEALQVCNHRTGRELALVRPPASAAQAGLPGWVLPAAVVLAGGDAASGLLDPTLPALLAAGTAAAMGSVVAGNNLLLPRLKQLPAAAVRVEETRQQLLAQHAALDAKVKSTLQEASEDVRVLARLWQLQDKMRAVEAGAAGSRDASPAASRDSGSTYQARLARVAAARSGLEQRIARRLELLDGYARVMNMIEIEIEVEIEVPDAEVAGIEEQIGRLAELEGLEQEWQLQAEARDEVERLLRSPSLMG